jgi:hypothetical protein
MILRAMKVSLPMENGKLRRGRACHCAEFISTSQKIGYLLKIKIKTPYLHVMAEYLPVVMVMNGIFVCSWLLGLLVPLPIV